MYRLLRGAALAAATCATLACATTQEAIYNPPLIKAAGAGDSVRVRQLLSEGVDVDVRNPWNDTALLDAVFRGHDEVAMILLAANSDVNVRNDPRGSTALMGVRLSCMPRAMVTSQSSALFSTPVRICPSVTKRAPLLEESPRGKVTRRWSGC